MPTVNGVSTRFCFLAIAVVTSATALGCTDNDERERERFERNRARWAANGFADYDARVNTVCFGLCREPDVLVQVRNGRKVAVVDAETRALLWRVLGPDVEELFDSVESAIDDADFFEVEYDRALGYPSLLNADFVIGAADDEFRFEVRSLIATTEPVPALEERVVTRRAQWEASGIDDYSFVLLRESRDLPAGHLAARIEVNDGIVVARVERETGSPLDPALDPLFPSIDGLFDVLESALEADPEVLLVGFNGILGHPDVVEIDFDARAPGRELYVVIGLSATN